MSVSYTHLRNNSPAIRRMYNDLLMEAARAEKQRDPYVLYLSLIHI